MIDEIAETDMPAFLAMNGSVTVRKPCAMPAGSVTRANRIGCGLRAITVSSFKWLRFWPPRVRRHSVVFFCPLRRKSAGKYGKLARLLYNVAAASRTKSSSKTAPTFV